MLSNNLVVFNLLDAQECLIRQVETAHLFALGYLFVASLQPCQNTVLILNHFVSKTDFTFEPVCRVFFLNAWWGLTSPASLHVVTRYTIHHFALFIECCCPFKLRLTLLLSLLQLLVFRLNLDEWASLRPWLLQIIQVEERILFINLWLRYFRCPKRTNSRLNFG